MRNSKSIGTDKPLVQIDIFIDFQCANCAKLETLWPDVVNALDSQNESIRTTYHIFLLEGHPIGWQAAFLALGAGGAGRFMELKGKLFAAQKEWKASGDPSAVLASVEGLQNQKDTLLSVENIKAAKAIIREDVGLGARLSVGSSPTVVITRVGTSVSRQLAGVQDVATYVQTIKEMLR